MSEAGKYKRPSMNAYRLAQQPHRGLGVRRDALGQLANDLNALIHNAADPFELAAHLEALGYNNKRTADEFNLPTPFALARKLFYSTERRPDLIKGHSVQHFDLAWRQLAIALTLFTSILLVATNLVLGPTMFVLLTLWLIVWSVTSTRLIYQAKQDLRLTEQKATFTSLIMLGLAGIFVFGGFTFNYSALLIGLLWWGVSAYLWLEHLHDNRRYLMAIVLLNVVALGLFLNLPVWLLALSLLLLTLAPVMRHLGSIKRTTFHWLEEQYKIVFPYAAYALGLGLLLIKLFQLFADRLWLAGALVILLFFIAEWLTVAVKASLAHTMWRTQSREEFNDKSLSSARSFWQVMLLFVVLSAFLVVQVLFPSLAVLTTHCLLLGLAGVFAAVLFSLNQVALPALLFLMAGLLSLTATPLIWVFIILSLCLVFLLSLQLNQVEDYGFYIIG